MRGRDRQLLRATFTPTDLDRFGIAVAFRSLKIQDSLRQTSETGGSFKPHQRLTDNRLISDATAGRRGGKQASRRAEGGNLVKSFVDREPRASVVGPTPSLTLEGGTARIEFETEVGKTYRLEYSATLDSPQWQSLGSREGTGDNEVIEVSLRDHSSGFFRMLHHQGVQPSADSIDG